jgi:hypothetical protein
MKIQQPPVSHECIDGEVVIINMETGTYYSLVGLAASLWQCIAAGTTRDALLARVADMYSNESAKEEAIAFLDALTDEGLIDLEAEPHAHDESVLLAATYDTPRLESFTDLQELLMLDPIHEVDATGWPHKN